MKRRQKPRVTVLSHLMDVLVVLLVYYFTREFMVILPKWASREALLVPSSLPSINQPNSLLLGQLEVSQVEGDN